MTVLALAPARWQDYLALTKPRVLSLLMLTALVGMLLASDGLPPWPVVLFGNLGIAGCAAAAAVLNQVLERDLDAGMARTRQRPLVQGRASSAAALVLAAGLGVAGSGLLLVFTNLLATVLTLASLLGYAVVYTLFLKPATPQNIVIGGLAGAAPPLLGWVAVTGEVGAQGVLLMLIIFTWTPPHFWALAIARRDDYARAGVPMLPVTHGVAHTTRHILFYTVALLAVSLAPVALGMRGLPYLLAALLLGAGFLRHAWRLLRAPGAAVAMATFRYSILYLFALFIALLVDHYWRLYG